MDDRTKSQLRRDLANSYPSCGRPVSIDLDSYELLLSFIPMKDEPDVTPVNNLALKKEIPTAVPAKESGTFIYLNTAEKGKTITIQTIKVRTLMLVPGVAFTQDGKRLGRGGGWYDRALTNLPKCIETVGICAKERLLSDLPTEEHDRKVSKVLVF